MSTRKLILTAFICGFAILLAGGIQLLRISRTDEVAKVYSIGESATVDGISVGVVSYSGDVASVRLLLPANFPAFASLPSHFSMQRGNSRFDAVKKDSSTDCSQKTAQPAQPLDCSLTFVPSGDGSTYLRFTSDNKTAVWALG